MKNTRTTLIAAIGVFALILVAGTASAGVLYVKNDNVGIGTDNPTVLLDVNSDTVAPLTTVGRFAANGAPLVFYKNNASGDEWSLRPTGPGDWTISLSGTGGTEFVLRKSGALQIGPGPATNFDLSATGNLTIAGTLTQGSSRAIKQNFEDMDAQQALARVADLDIVEWSYKNQRERHIGPMAEDFYSAFGLGAGETGLAPGDLAGVTLAALQGLNEVVEEKDQQIEKLTRELAELRAMVESLAGR